MTNLRGKWIDSENRNAFRGNSPHELGVCEIEEDGRIDGLTFE
jgi:hypothetical protein